MMLIVSLILILIIWAAFEYNLFSELTVCILIFLVIGSLGLSVVELINIQNQRYKDGPIFQKIIKIGNKECEEYRYYDKTIFKCDDRIVNIIEDNNE